jgi:4'-phosphopantetheinyl transferase
LLNPRTNTLGTFNPLFPKGNYFGVIATAGWRRSCGTDFERVECPTYKLFPKADILQKMGSFASHSFSVSSKDVHIWRFHLDASESTAAMFEDVLAADEKERAARFHLRHLRDSFVSTRGALRYILGRYLDVAPASIRFTYGPKGKPALASATSIQFNLTHSGSLAAVALTANCQIGVDLEQVRPLSDMQQIADHFFCPEEAAEIMSLPQEDRERAFFLCWTRKEAYTKAIGEGLLLPLNTFRVTLRPGSPAQFVSLEHEAAFVEAWTLHDLPISSSHAAAVAYHDRPRNLDMLPTVNIAELLSPL